MRRQHLDANGVEYGMLMQLSRGGMEERNLEFAAALSRAVNDWQLEDVVVKPEPRLRAGIVVPQEDAAFAVERDRARAPTIRRSSQILISPRASDPLGHRRYWPIYEAAQRCRPADRRCTCRASAAATPRPASGWPTYYMQEHYAADAPACRTRVTSLVFEGVFERFPKLKVVLIEGGFAWAPALCWRMDKHWERMRKETAASQAAAVGIRARALSGSPPSRSRSRRIPQHLADVIDWLGWDRMMFSTDYPHWDFDDPRRPSSSS